MLSSGFSEGSSGSTDIVLHPFDPEAGATTTLQMRGLPMECKTLKMVHLKFSCQVLKEKLHNCPADLVAMLAVAMCQIPSTAKSPAEQPGRQLAAGTVL